MSNQKLKERLEHLGYSAPESFKKLVNNDVVHIVQELADLDFLNRPKFTTLGYAWYEDRKYFLNYRYRIPHLDIREFGTLDEIVSFVIREFPLRKED